MLIKTFPLKFTEEYLEKIRQAAADENKSVNRFLLDLIEEELKKRNK